ncbi:hypothetical protein [Polaromonas sp.]
MPTPATQTVVETASLLTGRDFTAENDLLVPLKLQSASMAGLLARVNRQD